MALKVLHYAFLDITFHVVCTLAVCECKSFAKFQRSKCKTDKWSYFLPNKRTDSEKPETSHQ